MSPQRVAYIGATAVASCVLLLIALAIGGIRPATNGSPINHFQAPSASPSRYLEYSFSSSRIGAVQTDNAVPLVVTLALIAIAAIVVMLIARHILRRGFDKNRLLMLLGVVAATVLAFELVAAHYDVAALRSAKLPQATGSCEGSGTTIEILAESCSFQANGASSWTLNDDLLPTDLEFETTAGAIAVPAANSNQPQFAVGVSKCSTLSCSQHNLSFVVFLGISTKHDRTRDFTRTTRFLDTTPGRSEWFVSILTFPPHLIGRNSTTPTPKTKRGFGWRALIEVLSGTTLLVVVLALVGPAAIRRLRRRRGRAGDDDDGADGPNPMVESAPDQVLAVANEILDEGMDPRAAILRCWLELERLIGLLGLALEPSETADELTERLIQVGSTRYQELIDLHDLFLTARYSTRPIGESDRDTARALLAELRSSFASADISGETDRYPVPS